MRGMRCIGYAVLLCGAGRAFAAGGDLATLRADPAQGARDLLGPLNQALLLLQGLNAPVIAQVHGAAAGVLVERALPEVGRTPRAPGGRRDL